MRIAKNTMRAVKGKMAPSTLPFILQGRGRKLGPVQLIAGLAAWMFFLGDLQSEPSGSSPLWLRYPAISPDAKTIAFSFEGHILSFPPRAAPHRR
jgi:hypothetical protein